MPTQKPSERIREIMIKINPLPIQVEYLDSYQLLTLEVTAIKTYLDESQEEEK